MTKYLLNIFLMLSIFSYKLQASKITETYNGFIIESEEKISKSRFNIDSFIDCICNLEKENPNKHLLEIDLSNNEFVTSSDIKQIIRISLKKNLKIKILNIFNTEVDIDIIDVCKPLLNNKYFKILNIANTLATQDLANMNTKSKILPKIIFIRERDLTALSLNRVFNKDIIDKHLAYYQTAKTFSQAWNEAEFEGINMRQVVYLAADAKPLDISKQEAMQKDLVNSTTLTNLKTLIFEIQTDDIDKYKLDEAFISSLSNNITFSNLTNLNLKSRVIGNKGVELLAKGKLLKLESLNLHYNDINDEGLKYLALTKDNFTNLKELDLSANYNITAQGLIALGEGNFSNLTSLSLAFNESMGSEGLKALFIFTNLQILDLFGTKLGFKGTTTITESNFVNLTKLNLGRNRIGDEGAKVLANANFPKLVTLDLRENGSIRTEGKKALKALKNKQKIKNLWF